MSRVIRTLLFMFFVGLFVVGAPALALYAQGYRINWPPEPGKKLIAMTGGFFAKTHPKQTEIYVNGTQKKETDFFFDSALVENLLPRHYKFQVKKTGYFTWEKNLEIKEKEVTEARNITLFPKNLNFSAVEKNINGILPSPDGKKIALRQNDDAGWNLKLYDTAQNITVKLAGQNNFSVKNPQFYKWEWNGNGKTLNVSIAAASSTADYAIATDKNPAQIIKIGAALAASTTQLATFENNGDRYFLDNDGYIYKNDSGANPAKAVAGQIAVKPDTDYKLQIFGNYYFVLTGTELFAFNAKTESFEKILDAAITDPKISPNGKKIVYCSDSEIWVYFLEDKTDQPPANAGDKIFIARLSEKITDCDWFNSDYLVFAAGDAVKAAETDNRDKVNIVDLAKISQITKNSQTNETKIFPNPDKKIIYLFSGNTLYKSETIE